LPLASNLNFVAGQTVANRVMVAVGNGGQVTIYNGVGSVDVIADVSGSFTDAHDPGGGAPYVATIPTRLIDTRTCACKLGPGYVLDLQLIGGPATSALVLNVTATNSTAYGYLTVYPDDGTLGQGPPPLASDLNLRPHVTLANLCVVMMSGNGAFNIYNGPGSTDVIVDAQGYYGGRVLAPPDRLLSPLIASESSGSLRLPYLYVRVPARLRVPRAG